MFSGSKKMRGERLMTQEERIAALERDFATFRKETASRTQEIEENTIIILGVIRSQGRDIRKTFESLDVVNQGFGIVSQGLGVVSQDLETVSQGVVTVRQNLDTVNQGIDTVNQRFDTYATQLNDEVKSLKDLTTRSDRLESLIIQVLEGLPKTA